MLRRFGLAKATVVDVARALDVSTAASIAIFKQGFAARRRGEALARLAPMRPEKIAEGSGRRPRGWNAGCAPCLRSSTRRSATTPRCSTYLALAQEAREVVKAHMIASSIRLRISSDGVKQGAFHVTDVKASARAIFDATIRFHHPAHPRNGAIRRYPRGSTPC